MPRALSHVVYFVADVAKAEAFYVQRLVFRCTDRFTGAGQFLQPVGLAGAPHALLHQCAGVHKGWEHFTFHFAGPGEMMQNGWRFVAKGCPVVGTWKALVLQQPVRLPHGDGRRHGSARRYLDARELPLGADTSQAFLLGYRKKWSPGPSTSQNGNYA